MLSRDWLLIQGTLTDEIRRFHGVAVHLFADLYGLNQSDVQQDSSTLLSTFSSSRGQVPCIVRTSTPDKWSCAAGTFMTRNAVGNRVLETLANDPADLGSIEGAFAIAIYNAALASAQVITDRIGTLHVYKAQVGTSLLISTSSMVLAAMRRAQWDVIACREFLAMGTVFEQKTLFAGIEKLRPASIYHFRNAKEQGIQKYWDLGTVLYDKAAFRGTTEGLAESLQSAFTVISKHYPSAVLDLTGGFDSRALLAAMLAAGARFDTVVNGPADHEDVMLSKPVAESAGVQHHHQTPRTRSTADWWRSAEKAFALCDGEYDALEYSNVFDVHSDLAPRFDATINGSNGEICKGYWWELLAPYTGRKGRFDSRRVAAGRFAFAGEHRLMAADFPLTIEDHMAEVIRRVNSGLEEYPNTAQMDNVYLTLRMQRWQGRLATATNRIWPCISPFMFSQVMSQALASPPNARVRNRMSRRSIELLNPALARLPVTGGGPALPLRISTAHRFGGLAWEQARRLSHKVFSGRPPAAFTSNPIRELWSLEQVRDLLNPAHMQSIDLYDRAALSRVLAESQGDSWRDGRLFGRILTLERLARAVYANPKALS